MKNVSIVDENNNEFIVNEFGYPVGFEFPNIRSSIEEVAGSQSAVFITSKAGIRPLSFQGTYQTDIQAQRRLLQRVSSPGSLKTLKFTTCDDIDLQTAIHIEKIVSPPRGGKHKYLVEAIGVDWRFYSQTLNEFTTIATVVTGGMRIPAEVPYDIGGASSVANVLTNDGTDYADPIMRIDGPGTRFTVENLTTGGAFIIEQNVLDGQYIEIDYAARTIRLSGYIDIYSSKVSGDFWNLAPGENQIKFYPESSGENTLLTITWRDAYLGV